MACPMMVVVVNTGPKVLVVAVELLVAIRESMDGRKGVAAAFLSMAGLLLPACSESRTDDRFRGSTLS